MKLVWIIATVILISIISINFKVIDYDSKWKQTDKFIADGLPKSALKVVDEIYKSAKDESNSPQIIKSLIYRISLKSKFQEDRVLKSISFFEKEIQNSSEIEKQILLSLTASLYQEYYIENRYKINSRNTLENYKNDDVSTWDALSFENKIKSLYLQSIENKSFLKEVPLEEYSLVLNEGESSDFKLFPTLYDLLANRCIFYLTNNQNIGDIIPLKNINIETGLSTTDEFLKSSLTNDTLNSDEKIIAELFKDLIGFHLERNNIDALIDIELRRLNYYKQKANSSAYYDDKYLKSLFKLKSDYKDNSASVKISYEIGSIYEHYGNQYDRLEGEKNRWYLAKAIEVYKEAAEKFPDSKYTPQCIQKIKQLESVELSFINQDIETANNPFLASLSFKNTDRVYFKIIKIVYDDYFLNNWYFDEEKINELLELPSSKEFFVDLPNAKDYQQHRTEIKIPALDFGYYIILSSTDSTFKSNALIASSNITISNLAYISKSDSKEQIHRLFVVDRISGKGIKNVDITVSKRIYSEEKKGYTFKDVEKLKTGKNGLIELNKVYLEDIRYYVIRLQNGEDVLYSSEVLRNYRKRPSRVEKRTWLFTDRSIYKPGQIVYFKGISTSIEGNDYSLLSNENDKVVLKNANYKTVNEINLTTNEYGSFTGEFTIPQGMMNGRFSIQSNNGDVYFQVEDYKRPNFKVVFDSIKDQYKLDDNIIINGKVEDYAGSAVANSEVKFKVKREQQFPVWPYYNYYYSDPVEIENGIVKTNDDGSFSIQFMAESGNSSRSDDISYLFNIEVYATDITGETQSALQTLRLSDKYIYLSINADKNISREKQNGIEITARNSSNYKLKAEVTAKLYKLISPVTPLLSRNWEKPDVFLMGKNEFKQEFPKNIYKNEDELDEMDKSLLIEKEYLLDGEQNILSDELKNLNPGLYYLEIIADDKSGEEQNARKYFSLFSTNASKVSDNKMLSLFTDKSDAEVGEEITISISSAEKSMRVYYEVVNNNIPIIKKWIKLSKSQRNIKIPIEEDFRGGFSIYALAVKDNRVYSLSKEINVPYENNNLDIKLETFRDYLTPGKDEEWNITISDESGKAAVGELLASMYDASLDKFEANSWNFNLSKTKYPNSNWKSSSFGTEISRVISSNNRFYINPVFENYPEFNWFGFDFYGNRYMLRSVAKSSSAQTTDGLMEVMEDEALLLEVVEDDMEVADNISIPVKERESDIIPLRTNFNETAFFYPQLKTDEEGKTIISFKTPDALTEWKLMLLAHDKELKIGKLVKNIKAKKELMLLPNIPRFVRHNDEISFTTKVVNLSLENMSVEVEIEFFDALSMQKLNITEDNLTKNVSVDSKSNAALSWQLKIPDNISLLTYRLRAKTDKYSDGEERTIPVLTNRMLVTETMPMFINANQNKNYNFNEIDKKLASSNTIKNYSFTIEFTSNPVWYAIQALPSISENNNKSTLSAFHRYYANSLSAFILNENPKIKTVFEHWKEFSSDSFLSKLQKNDELKSAVLEASPWVFEAENEEEQKHRLGVMFDLNKLSVDKSASLGSLENSQLPSGAWPWFEGMREDEYTTQKIVLGFARLNDRGIISIKRDRYLNNMIRKAINYLDNEIIEDYSNLRKNSPQTLSSDNLSSSKIQYLYLRSLLMNDFPLKKGTDAFKYYVSQARKYWLKKNNYLQAMIAISLNRLSYRNDAEGIIRSLEERSISNEEMGMYWRQNMGWYWYEAPIETQAMIIEAFMEIQNQEDLINRMKVWLIKQKQTQSWSTNSATAEAVFALLKGNGNSNINNSEDVEIKLAGKTLQPLDNQQKEAGTGYFKRVWREEKVNPELTKIDIHNPNNNVAWGAAYWQYFEDIDKIKSANTQLSIEKKLFVEKLTDKGAVIIPIEKGDRLNIGQKVFSRIIIRSDRDMEFVHLKDMRSSTFEPVENISSYKYSGGLGYYENIQDIQTDFFIRYLKKGTYVIEYPVFVSQKGKFTNGIASIQSMYAPEFSAHSEGVTVEVK